MLIKVKDLRKLIREQNETVVTLNDQIEELLRTFSEMVIDDGLQLHNFQQVVPLTTNTQGQDGLSQFSKEEDPSFTDARQYASDDLVAKLKPLVADKIALVAKQVLDNLKNGYYTKPEKKGNIDMAIPVS